MYTKKSRELSQNGKQTPCLSFYVIFSASLFLHSWVCRNLNCPWTVRAWHGTAWFLPCSRLWKIYSWPFWLCCLGSFSWPLRHICGRNRRFCGRSRFSWKGRSLWKAFSWRRNPYAGSISLYDRRVSLIGNGMIHILADRFSIFRYHQAYFPLASCASGFFYHFRTRLYGLIFNIE